MKESTRKLFNILKLIGKHLLLAAFGFVVFYSTQIIAFLVVSKKIQNPETETTIKAAVIIIVGSSILGIIAYLVALFVHLLEPQKRLKALGIMLRHLFLIISGLAVFRLIQIIAFIILSRKMPDPDMATMAKATMIILIGSAILGSVAYLTALFIYVVKRQYRHQLAQAVFAVIILAIAAQFTLWLIDSKKKPDKKPRNTLAPLVTGQTVYAEDVQVTVYGYGTVRFKKFVKVVPQVSGQIIECHTDMVNGGFFKAGEVLVKIDPRDYEYAVESAEAAVAKAQVSLDKEQAEAQVARQEWQQIHPGEKPASSLVLREPQVREAKAQLKSANAQLATAKLSLERTAVSVPFDGRVLEETVDIGQYLMPGQSIATVYGTDAVEIMVPLEDKELAWFDAPMAYEDGSSSGEAIAPGVEVLVKAHFAGRQHVWTGHVVRTEGRIDPTSRMVNVVVEVEKPFAQKNGRVPLTPGMFVEIEIKGKMLKNIILVPETALHDRTKLWVANDNKLQIRDVEIARMDDKYAYIVSGIKDGEIVITESLDAVTYDMKIRIQNTDTEPSGEVN